MSGQKVTIVKTVVMARLTDAYILTCTGSDGFWYVSVLRKKELRIAAIVTNRISSFVRSFNILLEGRSFFSDARAFSSKTT